jgi:hypothetical protein
MPTPFDTHRRSDRLKNEIQQLREAYGSVSLDHEHDGIIIDRYTYPAGWQPGTAAFMIRPTTLFPREQPAAYIPDQMRYTHGVPRHFWKTTVDGFLRWCMHPVPWNPQAHDLMTFTELIEESLANPTETDPWTWSSDLDPDELPIHREPKTTTDTDTDINTGATTDTGTTTEIGTRTEVQTTTDQQTRQQPDVPPTVEGIDITSISLDADETVEDAAKRAITGEHGYWHRAIQNTSFDDKPAFINAVANALIAYRLAEEFR